MGTLRYMSPEQWRGEEAHPAWDLWALAVVAYEMLTGAHPFDGTPSAEWSRAVLAGRFTPLAAYLPEAPPRWQEFFERTFAPEPTRRPASAAGVLFALVMGLVGGVPPAIRAARRPVIVALREL